VARQQSRHDKNAKGELNMRALFLSVIAAAAIVFPAGAQTSKRGVSNGNIVLVYTAEVQPGQDEAFKQLVPKLVATAEQEAGTLVYEWSMRADGKTFDVVEIYQDSAAVIAHGKDIGSKFGTEWGQAKKFLKVVIYGDPDADARKALARLNPEYQTPIAGFIK
jgi:quinol monooxygenase YgiN